MTGTYEIIYADPPWRYSAKKVQGAAENHYPTMSIDELCALPVAELAAKDSALFMWATFPQLPEALRLIRAWGFTYKSVAFVWLKKNKKADSWFYGLGFWTRANSEICLLATKGRPKRQAADIHPPPAYLLRRRGCRGYPRVSADPSRAGRHRGDVPDDRAHAPGLFHGDV